MTIYALKSRFQDVLRPSVRRLHALGVTANQVTVAACIVSVLLGAGLAWTALADLPLEAFVLLPVWMLLRMALNAVDGMLAREFGQSTPLGTYLNELTDVISDAALYLPFAFVAPFGWPSVGAVIFGAALSEMAGVVGVMDGVSRRYDGPMGKSDRAFVVSFLALWVALAPPPDWAVWIVWAVAAATAWTTWNRVRQGLGELDERNASNRKDTDNDREIP